MKRLTLQNTRFIALREGYQEWLATMGYSSTVIYANPNYLNEFLHFLEEHQVSNIENVNQALTYAYSEYLKTRKSTRRNGFVSNRFVNAHSFVLEQFSRYLLKEHNLIIPLKIKRVEEHEKPKDILTQAEIALVYQACESDYLGLRDRAMLSLLYGCGLRSSEGNNLELRDIFFEKGIIHIKRTKNHQDRLVPMTESVKNDLRNYLLYSRPFLLKQYKNNNFLISRRGCRPDSNALRRRLVNLLEKTSITLHSRSITLHSLRHSIATHFLQKGMKLEDIRQFLGHLSLESTQIYTHILHEIQ